VSWWIVTWADRQFEGMAVFIEADEEQHAAVDGLWALMQADDPPEQPTKVNVLLADDARPWRATYSADPVPDEFKCCGGMPRLSLPGTVDEHCATCEHYVAPDAE
jgi:hypothetical protein